MMSASRLIPISERRTEEVEIKNRSGWAFPISSDVLTILDGKETELLGAIDLTSKHAFFEPRPVK